MTILHELHVYESEKEAAYYGKQDPNPMNRHIGKGNPLAGTGTKHIIMHFRVTSKDIPYIQQSLLCRLVP